MFHAGNIQGITKYILLSALALSSECFAAVNRDDNIYNFTTRSPNVEENFTEPTHSPKLSDYPEDDTSDMNHFDMVVFFVVATVSAVFIGILICILQRDKSSSTNTTTGTFAPISGAVIHPPPSRLVPPPAPTAPVAYYNSGYQNDSSSAVDGRPSDVPPDYATVTIGDLSKQEKSRFPNVMPKLETPPPSYPVGHPFSNVQ